MGFRYSLRDDLSSQSLFGGKVAEAWVTSGLGGECILRPSM